MMDKVKALKTPGPQLVTGDRAKKTLRQHRRPCSDCPFARWSVRGWLGHMTPEEWMQLAHGEGTADCHTTDKQCAGLAVYHANVCKVPRDPKALRLPVDRRLVFASSQEFLEHHNGGIAKSWPKKQQK
jgi:hypothetical protein